MNDIDVASMDVSALKRHATGDLFFTIKANVNSDAENSKKSPNN